ncbi:hypothetical protein GGF44_002134 [Coemansia sp. RSA 1694]|nr:hypothetical protein GGF44_002134 [Coemansia sp. RSA 1694]
MSPAPSTFQSLPGFILKRICQFTTLRHASPSKSSHLGDPFRHTYRTDLFNSLCQEWTQVASELYFKDYKIEIIGELNLVKGVHSLTTLDVPVASIFPVVKHMCVNLGFADIISGKALNLLRSSIYSAATFPIARTVRITFTDSNDSISVGSGRVVERENIVENLTKFVEAIKPMFPRLNKIYVVPGVDYNTLPYSCYTGFVQFVELLHCISNNSLVEVDWPVYISQESPAFVTGLSGININRPREVSIVEALIHKNANTLISLSIANTRSNTFVNVFETPQGDAVAYPLLEKLAISSTDKVPKPKYSREHAPILLPRLENLSIKWGHPFHDDVLFRGNRSTLARVILMLDADFMAMLQKFKVFEGASHPKLLRATIWNDPLGDGDKIEQGRLFCAFALNMTTRVPSLYVQGRFQYDKLATGIAQKANIPTLQSLKLLNASLSFGALLALVGSLPNLREIAIMRLIPDQKCLETDPRIQLEQLHASHYPLSSQLQYVKYLASNSEDSMMHNVRCSMYLALLCPRFTRFVVCGLLRKSYNRNIRKAIKAEPFINYADRLGRLAFNDVGENNMKFTAKPLVACNKTKN